MSSICVFNFQMSDNSNNYPPSRKRPGENPDSGPDLGPCEHPMETDDSGVKSTEHENGNQKKMKKSDSGKTPSDSHDSGPDLVSELPMEIEDSGDTATEHEKGNRDKMKKSDSKEKLGIEPEKSKVKFIKLNFQYC
jgi:hypothetical protein